MYYSLVLIIVLLGVFYYFSNKIGFTAWFRTTAVHHTKTYKCIRFLSKVYALPSITTDDAKEEKKKIRPKIYAWLSFIYLFLFGFGVYPLLIVADDAYQLHKIRAGSFEVVSGQITKVRPQVKGKHGPDIWFQHSSGEVTVIQYRYDQFSFEEMEKIIGRLATVGFIFSSYELSNQLVNLKIAGVAKRSVYQEILTRESMLDQHFNPITILLFLIVPWIKYRKYGLKNYFSKTRA